MESDALGIGVEGAAGEWWCSLIGIPWSGAVIHDPWQVQALKDTGPARLIVMLCDPLARFVTDPVSGPARASANASFQRGLYADLLVRLWRVVLPDRVLVLQQERCLTNPAGELARTRDFLGLDGARSSTSTPPPSPFAPLRPDQHRTLARAYAPENRRLAALLPDLDMSLWESAA
jgi:hypothetical protein